MNKEKESKAQSTSEKEKEAHEKVTGNSSAEGDTSASDAVSASNGKSVASESPELSETDRPEETGEVSEPLAKSDAAADVSENVPSSAKPENSASGAEREAESADDDPEKNEKPDSVEVDSVESTAETDSTTDETITDEPLKEKSEAKSDQTTPVSNTEPETSPEKKDSPDNKSTEESPATETEPATTKAAEAEKKKEGLHSEEDLKEKDEDDHSDEDEEVDYSELTREELVNIIKELAKSEQVIKAEREAREVKSAFDELREKERQAALDKFVADGNEAADFAYRPDELTLRFDANYQLIRDRKSSFVKNKEQQKETNLRKKEEILERLREFVDSEETNISFDSFKALQEEWKAIGPVPGAVARSLWANYNALVDRFYDKRSIYFELKELDRKKNLESKLELCTRAEGLSEVTNINDAIKELNDLHHEFKHIGPVPADEQEPLWQRFKAASDAVYERRKEFVEKLKGELENNLQVKLELAEKVQEFAEFDSDRIKAWNEKTRELLDIQKKWEITGGLPRARAKEVNRTFWSSFKQFFSNKNHFFKKLDAEREKNLEIKKAMVEKARELQQSDDWHSTADALKGLQREWKDVGPVPGKYRESIYKEFKEACDKFFERKRASQDDASKEYVENYKKKTAICEKIEKLARGDKNNLEEFRSLQEEYNETGFVPRNKITDIRNKYSEVVNKYVKALDGMSDEEKQRIKIENQVSDILHSPNADQKLYRKEQSLRKQISTIENDIALWKNNLEFFADSKKADKLKDEFQSKIDNASDELKQLKQQLRIIRTA